MIWLNSIFNRKVVRDLGYNVDDFLNLPRCYQEKILLEYWKGNVVSLSKEKLNFILKNKIDDIIERENNKKELIKKLMK